MKHILSILSLGFIAYVQAQVYKGNYCEYIVPTDLPAKGNNCNNDGYKFVVKGNNVGANKIRKQFLYVDGKVIIAFVENGKKFADCTSFTDVTGSVNCKLVTGLPGTSLTSTSGGGARKCRCGEKKDADKIVGGQPTKVHEYPWAIGFSFSSDGDPRSIGCGASLIADQWAITAAHCASIVEPHEVTLVLGEHDLDSHSESDIRLVVKVAQIFTHPNYKTPNHDISVLKLAQKVDLEIYTPVCLPPANANYAGKIGFTYGWGTTSYNGEQSSFLLEVPVPIVSWEECANSYGSGKILPGMVCAGEEGKDACQGDSGGALSVPRLNSGDHELVGAVSWGRGCGWATYYGVYADISYYRSFILNTIEENGGGGFC